MNHPWFQGVDWGSLERKEIGAPIVPRVGSMSEHPPSIRADDQATRKTSNDTPLPVPPSCRASSVRPTTRARTHTPPCSASSATRGGATTPWTRRRPVRPRLRFLSHYTATTITSMHWALMLIPPFPIPIELGGARS
jgi:hypothetical protein